MRSIVRRAWLTHPEKFKAKKAVSFKKQVGVLKNGKPKFQNYCRCAICGKEFPATQCEVDHIKSGGAFSGREGWKEWAARILYITPKDLQVLDKGCHAIKTHADRYNLTFKQAEKEKELIEFAAKKASAQKRILKGQGFSEKEISNGEKRKMLYKKCCLK